MKKIIPFVLIGLFFAAPVRAFTLSDFETPESVVADPEDGSYYVSNINGDPSVKDGNGYISKISSNANIVTQKYIGGTKENPLLDAPKGLAILGKRIFVTDIDSVKIFDKESRNLLAVVDCQPLKVKFLNDIATDGQNIVYVSDMLTDRILKINANDPYEPSVFLESPLLAKPNGVMVNPKTKNLMVVTLGGGEVLEIDDSKKIHILKKGLKVLDGIDYDNEGNLYVSSFEKGEIYQIGRMGRGPLMTYLSNLTTPADISFDRQRNQLLIPSFKGNTVSASPKLSKK